jgi:hypothetical protein
MCRLGSLYSTAAAELFEKTQTAGSGGRYCPYGVWLMRPDGRLLLPAICPEIYYPHDRAKGESRLGCQSLRVLRRYQPLSTFSFRHSRAKGRKTRGSFFRRDPYGFVALSRSLATVGVRLSRQNPPLLNSLYHHQSNVQP